MIRLLLLFILYLGSISCSSSQEKNNIAFFSDNVMTIDYRIVIGKALSKEATQNIQNLIDQTFEEVNVIYNKWNPNSELSKLNQAKAWEEITISLQMERLLSLTDDIVHLTEGRFDPTIEPLQHLWKSHLTIGQLPKEKDLQELYPSLGWHNIHFSNGIFYKDHDLTRLDLGGIAKGYCVDLLVERLNEAGYPDVFVEWGGEIRASGQHPDQRPWKIFISGLGSNDLNQAIAILTLNNQAIATSGDYLQNWQVGNEHYFHIIDPTSKSPLKVTNNSVSSASVLANRCAIADGIATALMIFPNAEKANEWAEYLKITHPELQFWIVSR